MPNGTVKFFNTAKGFGFITPDEGGKELFVPAASVASAGISSLKTGQRVSFEAQPDSKGPKAVSLTLLANAQPLKLAANASNPAPNGDGKASLTFYHDPASDVSRKALARIRAAGREPRVVEYLTAPPAREELKNLSVLLRGSDQSLVRKYDPLFQELCLDDRFISENEFWGAIFEHPSLINGPLVATETKASIFRSENDAEKFLAALTSGGMQPAPKHKSLPQGILRMIMGGNPPAEKNKAVETAQGKPLPETAISADVSKKPAAKPQPGKSVTAQKTPKPKPKPAARSKNKPGAAKSKKPAVHKPARKSRR